jgi:hypothetical protein
MNRSMALIALLPALALAAPAGSSAQAATPAAARGDFDRDGVIDHATVVRGSDGHYRVLVHSGPKGSRIRIVYDFGPRPGDDFVARANPGRYETACHQGYGPDSREGRPCRHDYLVPKGDVFTFGVAEASEAVAWWTGRDFDVVWMSD